MGLMADQILQQMRSIGEPRITKATTDQTVTSSDQPLNIGMLGMILMMLLGGDGLFGKGTPGTGAIMPGGPGGYSPYGSTGGGGIPYGLTGDSSATDLYNTFFGGGGPTMGFPWGG